MPQPRPRQPDPRSDAAERAVGSELSTSQMRHARQAPGEVQPEPADKRDGPHAPGRERRRRHWYRTPNAHRWRSSRSRRMPSSDSATPSTLPRIGSPSLVSIARRSRRTGSIRMPVPSGINSSCVSGVIPSATRRAFGMTTRPTRSIVTSIPRRYQKIGKLVAMNQSPDVNGRPVPATPVPTVPARARDETPRLFQSSSVAPRFGGTRASHPRE